MAKTDGATFVVVFGLQWLFIDYVSGGKAICSILEKAVCNVVESFNT